MSDLERFETEDELLRADPAANLRFGRIPALRAAEKLVEVLREDQAGTYAWCMCVRDANKRLQEALPMGTKG